MKYFLLQNRRHLGPYTPAQLESLSVEKSISPQAYVVSEENADLGKLNYQRLGDVIKVKRSDTVSGIHAGVEIPRVASVLPPDEISVIEQSFNEAVDPLDLVGPTTAAANPDNLENAPVLEKSFQEKLEFQFRNIPKNYVVSAVLLLGVFVMGKSFVSGSSPKTASKPEVSETQRLPASPAQQQRGAPGGSLSDSMNLGPAAPSPTIRVPKVREIPQAQNNDPIEVEENIDQGETPEPVPIKRRPKKPRRKPAEHLPPSPDELDGTEDTMVERDPATNEEDEVEDPPSPEDEMQDSADY